MKGLSVETIKLFEAKIRRIKKQSFDFDEKCYIKSESHGKIVGVKRVSVPLVFMILFNSNLLFKQKHSYREINKECQPIQVGTQISRLLQREIV